MSNTFKEDVAIGAVGNVETALAHAASTLIATREQAVGAREAFRLGQNRIVDVMAKADVMMEEKELSPEERKAMKRGLELAHGSLESLWQTTDVSVHELAGQIKAFNLAMRITTKQKLAYQIARKAIQDGVVAPGTGGDGERSAPRGTKALRERDLEVIEGGKAAEDGPSALELLLKEHDRPALQKQAKQLGLVATGKTADIAQRVLDGRNTG